MPNTFVHGKDTVVKVNAVDLSYCTDSSEMNETTDSHDTTTYGNRAHRKNGGLDDGSFTMSGTYDRTAVTGPAIVFKAVKAGGVPVPIIVQPDGAGTGKAQDSFDALLVKYTRTNPVADMVKWSAEFEIDGEVDDTVQA